MPSNVIQIRDAEGNAKYPITDASIVLGLEDITGDLSDLETTDKTSLVAAINEVATSGGSGPTVEHLSDESDMPASPDSGTLYLIDDDGGGSGGGVSDVTLGGTSVVSSGVAALPAYPTTLPASDVYSWAKASSKPTYTASEVGALPDSTVVPNITISSSEPTSSDGSNGDIWIVI